MDDDKRLSEFLNSIDLVDTSITNKKELYRLKLEAINGLIYHPTFIQWHTFLKLQSDDISPYANDYYRAICIDVARLLETGLKESVRYYGLDHTVNFTEEGSIKDLFKEFGILYVGNLITRDSLGPFASLLYLIGEFSANYQWISGLFNCSLPVNKYLVGDKLNFVEPIKHKPVVLTGDIIWNSGGFIPGALYLE